MTSESAMEIEIVVHVYCPPGLDIYAQMLRWQWASLERWVPPIPVTFTVAFTGEDEETSKVVEKIFLRRTQNVRLKCCCRVPERLFRRAIVRNERALATEADIIWFVDCDYIFGEHCIEDIAANMTRASGLCIPQEIAICKDTRGIYVEHENPDHAVGDAMLRRGRVQDRPLVDPEDFQTKRIKQAIGGVQIVGSELAHRIGYLEGTKWVNPVSRQEGFRSCRGDAVWRRSNKLKSTRIPIRGIYRLRHSRDGRDYDITGEKIGKEVW